MSANHDGSTVQIPALPRRRWLRMKPAHLMAGLILAVFLLWLSERFRWFGFNHHKGWTVMIALAATAIWAIGAVLWWIVALILRRRPQFSLRSLLLFVVAASIACSWLGAEFHRARRQSAAVAAITKAGGAVTYRDDDRDFEHPEQNQPTALESVFGIELFTDPHWILFKDDRLGTDVLDKLKDVAATRALTVMVRGNADSVLEHVGFAPELRQLDLGSSNVTDAGLNCLDNFPRLEDLDLNLTKISSAGLRKINCLRSLRDLNIQQTNVGDDGMIGLSQCRKLQTLYARESKITDKGLKYLNGLPELFDLRLDGDQITDTGFAQLKDLPGLICLCLSVTQITDASVDHFKDFPRLAYIAIDNTQITDAGLKKLHASMPKCQIDH